MTTQTPRANRKKREPETADQPEASSFLVQFSEHEESVQRLLRLMDALEKRGLLEPAIGLLEDEKAFTEIMTLLSSDDALQVVQNAKAIITLLAAVDYSAVAELAQTAQSERQALAGAASLVRLLSALESRGLIEPLVGLLKDEDAFSKIAKVLSSDAMLSLLGNTETLTQLSSLIDAELVDTLTKSVAVLKKDVKPVKGLWGVIGQLSDPAVAVGMGRVFEILRILGAEKSAKKEQG
jgi:uncharacterized protein YjgD (DUF1641 family)